MSDASEQVFELNLVKLKLATAVIANLLRNVENELIVESGDKLN